MAAALRYKLNGKLTFTIGEGKDLQDVLTIGTMDPFARIECGPEKFTTKVAKSGGRKPQWNQSFIFNLDGKTEIDRIHIHVYHKGLLTDSAIGRCDIPVETLLKATASAHYQIVSTTDFSKIAGTISLEAKWEGTGGPQTALPSFKQFTAAAAAASAASAAPVPTVVHQQPQVIYAPPQQPQQAVYYQPQISAQPQIVYQHQQPQIIYQQPQPQVIYQQPQQPQVIYKPQVPVAVATSVAPSNRCSSPNKQAGWRWCSRCQVLWYAQYNNSLGVCAAGGGHNYQGSGSYHAPLQSGNGCNGQTGWKWCCRCMALFYGAAVSVCPAGGAHDASGSGDYTMCLGNLHGQYGWGWCSRCGMFWYTNNKASSYCPAGGNHNNAGSGNYQLGHD